MATGQYTRPRTRSSVTIWHLPSELLLQIFEGIHIRDLLSLRHVWHGCCTPVNPPPPPNFPEHV